MVCDYLYILPLSVFLIFSITFFLTYTIAVLLKHVKPDFPYISDTGNFPPESCVFAELLNIGALLLAATVYLRYRQVKEYHRCFVLSHNIVMINKWAMWSGYVLCFGMTLIANFQQASLLVVHLLGAGISFGVGTLYFWFQAVISNHMYPIAHGIQIVRIRYVLSAVCTVTFILIAVAGALAKWVYFDGADPKSWYPTDGGWELHIVSTACEWITAIGFSCYILTFVPEFRAITLYEPPIVLRMSLTQIPDSEDTSIRTANNRPSGT